MNTISKTLAGAALATALATGISIPAHAQTTPTSTHTRTIQSATPATSTFQQFKWPTLKINNTGEVGVRFKPKRGTALPTDAGIDLTINAPEGTRFDSPTVRLQDAKGKIVTVTGTLDHDNTVLTLTAPDYRITNDFGVQIRFTLTAHEPTDGQHWAHIAITGGGALAATQQSYKYVGVTPDEVDFRITSPEKDSTETNPLWVLFAGYGTPGATVTLTENNTTLGTTTVKTDGSWAVTSDETFMTYGNHEVLAVHTDTTGQTTRNTVSFSMKYGKHVFGLFTPTEGAEVSPRPEITGFAVPGVDVSLFILDAKNQTIETLSATAGADGRWSATVINPLVDGRYHGRYSVGTSIASIPQFTVISSQN